MRKEGDIPNSLHKAQKTLASNHNEDSMRKENYKLISFINTDAKILNKIFTN
jgi:hypothetical protein